MSGYVHTFTASFSANDLQCERFSANFGEVLIPDTLPDSLPVTLDSELQCIMKTQNEPFSLGEFTTRAHEVAGAATIVSDRIIKLTNFFYDGTGPAAFFWIDSEPIPSNPTGKIAYDVGGSCGAAALAAYNDEEVFVELPSSVKNYLGGSLSVWVRTKMTTALFLTLIHSARHSVPILERF